ncbi:hypothetical protein [Sphingomonas sp. 10B4]|nr:hypothetical protein [Sphingomonas sp. 10B4]MDY7523652.1 hypothetical protein [Sphingomonas sp. 10B4]MEB0283669.1 hypothetical protein [Sphingomonas sp. 10B4]
MLDLCIAGYGATEAPFSASIGSGKTVGIYPDLAGTEVLPTVITTLKQTQANR